MAKFALIFLIAFVIVQVTVADRVVRDAPAAPAPSETPAVDKLIQSFRDMFSQDNINENLNKAKTELSKIGESLQSTVTQIQEAIEKKISSRK